VHETGPALLANASGKARDIALAAASALALSGFTGSPADSVAHPFQDAMYAALEDKENVEKTNEAHHALATKVQHRHK
jgi:hypothetical protein